MKGVKPRRTPTMHVRAPDAHRGIPVPAGEARTAADTVVRLVMGSAPTRGTDTVERLRRLGAVMAVAGERRAVKCPRCDGTGRDERPDEVGSVSCHGGCFGYGWLRLDRQQDEKGKYAWTMTGCWVAEDDDG